MQLRLLFINKLKMLLNNRCKEFYLGQGVVRRYTIIELRHLFSIYIHEINTIAQDRFHTHAFNAIGYTITGGYLEEQLPDINSPGPGKIVKVSGIRFIPRLCNHKLLRALPNTNTILFTGPYSELWTEEEEGWVRVLTTHGREIGRWNKKLPEPAKPTTSTTESRSELPKFYFASHNRAVMESQKAIDAAVERHNKKKASEQDRLTSSKLPEETSSSTESRTIDTREHDLGPEV